MNRPSPKSQRQRLRKFDVQDFIIRIIFALIAMALGISLFSVEPPLDRGWEGFEVMPHTFGLVCVLVGSCTYWSAIADISENPRGEEMFLLIVPGMGFASYALWRTIVGAGCQGSGRPTLWSIDFIRTGWLWAQAAFHLELCTGWWRNAVEQMIDYVEEKQNKSVPVGK
ncbi:hypothetical protein V8F20_007389 [Naviculisporaceae sp. PSN 640]